MNKLSLRGIWHGYIRTLVNASTGKPNKCDYFIQICTPIISGVLLFLLWPTNSDSPKDSSFISAIGIVSTNIVTGVSIVSSLMCGVAVMLFQLRVQLSSQEIPVPTRDDVKLIDEVYFDVLWSVLVGFASVVIIIASDIIKVLSFCLWKAALSFAFCLVFNLVLVSCMILRRLGASYEIVANIWGNNRKQND